MKAITVKYIGPSNVRGARMKAFDMDGNSVTLSYDYSASDDKREEDAAAALCKKMGWDGRMVHGATKEGEVFVFVD